MEDLGKFLYNMRLEEMKGDTSALLLALNQGKRAMQVKKACPKTWKSDLHEHVGKGKSTWHQRVAIVRDCGDFLLPEIPDNHVSTLPSSLAVLTQLTKGTDEKCRQAHLDEIAGMSYSDVKKYVAERKGKIPCECVTFIPKTIEVCQECGKRKKEEREDS